jgi:hypothetical protein
MQDLENPGAAGRAGDPPARDLTVEGETSVAPGRLVCSSVAEVARVLGDIDLVRELPRVIVSA